MTSSTPGLDDLIALNQEIAALIRAGVPLELGLKRHAATWPSRFASLADRLAQRLSLGESLVEALRQEGPTISPAYAAVVEAGLQSGRLAEALEQLANLGLTIQEVRRRVWLSATYPAIVCGLAYVMFVGFIVFGVPLWTETRDALFLPPKPLFTMLARLHDTVAVWGPLVPLGVAALTIGPWLWSSQRFAASRAPIRSDLWVPGAGFLFRQLQRAQFARLLAVLIEHDVPADRAVALAAESTGDRKFCDAARIISAELRSGATWREAVGRASQLPEYLKWMMTAGEKEGALPAVLRQAAEAYQRKADRRLAWIRGVLPVVLIAALSGVVVLAYSLCLFAPLQQFWFDLMESNP